MPLVRHEPMTLCYVHAVIVKNYVVEFHYTIMQWIWPRSTSTILYWSEQMIWNCTFLLPNTRVTHTGSYGDLIHSDDYVSLGWLTFTQIIIWCHMKPTNSEIWIYYHHRCNSSCLKIVKILRNELQVLCIKYLLYQVNVHYIFLRFFFP